MQVVYKNIDELKPYENNPRFNDDAVDKVAESIKEFGFKVPIIVDKNDVIVAGHTRYKACQKLCIDKVPCIIADDLTDKKIKAFRIADNKVSDYSFWDNKLLLEELEEIGDDIFTGFEESELFNDFDTELLDESDNGILESNEDGVTYILTFKSQNKKLIEKIKNIIENEEA